MNDDIKNELSQIIWSGFLAESEFSPSDDRRGWINDGIGMFVVEYDGASVMLTYELPLPYLISQFKFASNIESYIRANIMIDPEDVSYEAIRGMYDECKKLAIEIKLGEMNEY